MTHDELLELIDKDITFINDMFYKPSTGQLEIRDRLIRHLYAERAVVELHKPDNWGICEECNVGDYTVMYPCPTIKAVMDNLK